MSFQDRLHAGRRLSEVLERFRGDDVVVLGLPRGGVPVAAVVARALGAPLDVLLVRKVGVPFHPELAMGAIGEGGARVVNDDVVRSAGITEARFAAVEARERVELARRARRFRGNRSPVALAGRTAIIVDDGIATGSTAAAAVAVARSRGAARVVVAAPVGARESVEQLRRVADEVVCLEMPEPFQAVGLWYVDFGQTSDAEVELLLRGRFEELERDVEVVAGSIHLPGFLTVPHHATGVVVFAHGSGSSRNSPRNHWVAEYLNEAGFATLLFDLLTPAEQQDRRNVFDISLLGDRLAAATRWLVQQPRVQGLPIGFFGASTGAAAALWAAADPSLGVHAIVSRGGRPDLATEKLAGVRAPTLLIVGSRDTEVVELNRGVVSLIPAHCSVAVVKGATHLFEEPGTLQAAARAASRWFATYLSRASSAHHSTG